MINQERQVRLWRCCEAIRSRGLVRYDLFGLATAIQSQGEKLTLGDLKFLARKVEHGHVPPSYLDQFYCKFIESVGAATVLNPDAGYGWLSAGVSSLTDRVKIDTVSKYQGAVQIQQFLSHTPTCRFHHGTFSAVKERLLGFYDAIMCLPSPLGGPTERRHYSEVGRDLRDTSDHLLMLDAATLLSDAGVMLWVVIPRFIFDKSRQSVRRSLPAFGLHLNAILRIPAKAFLPATQMAFYVAVIEKRKRKDLFVAEIPEQADALDQLIARLHTRQEGPQASQGRLVKEDEFFGLDTIESAERAQRLAAGKGLEEVPFASAVMQVNLPVRHKRFEEHPDAVYLPLMAKTPATTSQDQLPNRLESYIQLMVNRKVIEPQYLAGLFNTPLGHALRDAARCGATIPRIDRQRLQNSKLYIPPLKNQREVVEASNTIDKLHAELSEFETRLWESPRKANQVIKALARINHDERFEEWIESLPFPLASILRTYHAADRTDRDRYGRLLHFFEALAEFLATVHLSAFLSDSASLESKRHSLCECLRSQNLSFNRSTFGLWKAVVENLSAEVRALISKSPDLVCSLYRVADAVFIEPIVSRSVLGVIQRTNAYRNRWTGHGGAVSENEAARRHAELRQELEKIREALGSAFSHYILIQAREAEILPGPVFRCSVRKIIGSNPQFEHTVTEVSEPAITGHLYMYNLGHTQVLEVAPLVQIRHTPQPACYFYNRFAEDGLHLVSYHFADKSEDIDNSTDTGQFMSNLNRVFSLTGEE